MHTKKIAVTKIDAARRQLETCIYLWYNDKDVVSIHTLAGAAHEILFHINKKNGGDPMLRDSEFIKPEYAKAWHKEFVKFQNFFKHADNDTHDTAQFPPEITPCIIMDAVLKYKELVHEKNPLFESFIFWHMLFDNSAFNKDFIKSLMNGINIDVFRHVSKKQFFDEAVRKFEAAIANHRVV